MTDEIRVYNKIYAPTATVKTDRLAVYNSIVELPWNVQGNLTAMQHVTFYSCVVDTPILEKLSLIRTPHLTVYNCGLNMAEILEYGEEPSMQTGCIFVEHPVHSGTEFTRVQLCYGSLLKLHLRNFGVEGSFVRRCVIDGKTEEATFINTLVETLEIRGEPHLRILSIFGPPPLKVEGNGGTTIVASAVSASPEFVRVDGFDVYWGELKIKALESLETRKKYGFSGEEEEVEEGD